MAQEYTNPGFNSSKYTSFTPGLPRMLEDRKMVGKVNRERNSAELHKLFPLN